MGTELRRAYDGEGDAVVVNSPSTRRRGSGPSIDNTLVSAPRVASANSVVPDAAECRAVVAATVSCTVLGGIWFAALFPKQYSTALGRYPEEKPTMTPLFVVGPLLCTLVTVLVSSVLVESLNVERISDAVTFGLIVGIGFLAVTMSNVAINPNEPNEPAITSLPYSSPNATRMCWPLLPSRTTRQDSWGPSRSLHHRGRGLARSGNGGDSHLRWATPSEGALRRAGA